MLEWFDARAQRAAEAPDGMAAAVDVGTGPFGEQVWVFPPFPPEKRWRSLPPRAYAASIASLLHDGDQGWIERPLVWVYVPLPAGSFVMGRDRGDSSERPAHKVAIAKPFALDALAVRIKAMLETAAE